MTADTSEPPAYRITTTDIARRCGVSVPTVRNWARAGVLPPPLVIGAVWRWNAAELETFFAARRLAPAAKEVAR